MNTYTYKSLIALVVSGLLLVVGIAPAIADSTDVDQATLIEGEAKLTVGYRGISSDDSPGRAREFDSLEPSPLFKAKFFTDKGLYHLDMDVNYLNEKDYSAEVHLDHSRGIRLDLRNTKFYHNLDHIPYANGFSGNPTAPARRIAGPFVEGSRPDAIFPATGVPLYNDFALTDPKLSPPTTKDPAYRAFYSDQNPGDDYSLKLDMSEARVKVKCPDFPAHLNLSYWRYEKEGERQLQFAGENCTSACHLQSKTRKIDRVTEEVKASVDAHAGFLDVVIEGLLRTFRDREPVPTDDFGTHSITGGKTFLGYQHDEDPDSKLKELTLRLNTAPSGGFVVSTAFTIGERENQSDLVSVGPVEAETDYYRASADANYTPSKNWTFNLRYRLLDMESDNTAFFKDYYLTNGGATGTRDMQVREAMDITRAWYEAVANYRPFKQLTLKAEFRREDIDRSNTGTPSTSQSGFSRRITDTWELPDEEIITRVKLGFSSRLLEKSALKLSGWLAFQKDDDPAYGTSVSEGQELYLSTSYTPSSLWGMMANLNLLKQENNDHEAHGYDLERDKQQQNITLGAWVAPREGLSFDFSYGYLRTSIDQDLLFGASADYLIEDEGVDYRQTVQTVTVGMNWQALDNLSCRLEGYHIRSKADYSPNFSTTTFGYLQRLGPNIYYFPGTASSADLHDISKVDVAQNGLKGRINWQLSEQLACGLEATFDEYDEKGNDIFDGSVQTYMASLSYTF